MGYLNEKITNEGIKELAVNISKLKNLTELNLNLRRLVLQNNNDYWTELGRVTTLKGRFLRSDSKGRPKRRTQGEILKGNPCKF